MENGLNKFVKTRGKRGVSPKKDWTELLSISIYHGMG